MIDDCLAVRKKKTIS